MYNLDIFCVEFISFIFDKLPHIASVFNEIKF